MPQAKKKHTAPHMKDTLEAALEAKSQQQGHGPAAPQQQTAQETYEPDLSMEQTAVKNELSKPRKGLQDRNN